MQEPTIYRAPIAVASDPETNNLPSEENTFKSATVTATVPSTGYDTASEKDYRDFVIPEGEIFAPRGTFQHDI
jgi:hypothetical protein